MAFQVTPYRQVCVNKIYISFGKFSLRKTRYLSQNCQGSKIFPVNSVKKRQILHNFANILAKNTKTPLKSTKAPIKNIGALIKNIGALIKNIGALMKNIGTPIKNIGIIVRTPFPPILGLTRLQIDMHNVGVRFIAPCGGAWRGNISLQGAINRRPNNFNSDFTQTTTPPTRRITMMTRNITLTAILAFALAFSSTAFAANMPKNCTDEITALSRGSGFDMQKFTSDLPAAVVKAKAQDKMPFGKPKDSDKTSIGMTFGCLKAFPESPGEIQSLLKDVGQEAATGAVADQYSPLQQAQPQYPPQYQYPSQQTHSQRQDIEQEEDGFKFGFYGSINPLSIAYSSSPNIGGGIGSIGLLFNFGIGLEIGLGLGYRSTSYEIKADGETINGNNTNAWEIIPSISYQINKKNAISYGIDLDVHLSSWSVKNKQQFGPSDTDKAEGMDMAFFPNFFLFVEVVKNFHIGLKTGVLINLPAAYKEKRNDPLNTPNNMLRRRSSKTTNTQIVFSWYL
jgi:hypothetical protein